MVQPENSLHLGGRGAVIETGWSREGWEIGDIWLLGLPNETSQNVSGVFKSGLLIDFVCI